MMPAICPPSPARDAGSFRVADHPRRRRLSSLLATCFAALGCLSATTPAASAERSPTARVVSFYGYDDCIRLENATTRVTLCPAAGGRVLEYAWKGKNALYLPPGDEGWTLERGGKGGWMTAGRFDIGPELTIPKHPKLWKGRWTAGITGPRSARMTSAKDTATGVQLVRDFTLAADGSRLDCQQTIRNVSDQTVEYCHWSRTFALGSGICIVPLTKPSRFPNGYVMYQPKPPAILLHPRDPHIRRRDGFLEITAAPKFPKLGFDTNAGWFGYLMKNDLLFVKRFPANPNRVYNEVAGLTMSIWYPSDRPTVELEPIGPREKLRPGESGSFTESWWLLPYKYPLKSQTVDLKRVGALVERNTIPVSAGPLKLSAGLRKRCLGVLRDALRSKEFWPSIHAAEAMTLAGETAEVRRYLSPFLKTEADDQKRCGIARELVRAGDAGAADVMLKILAGPNSHGHTHAAESLYKVGRIGDGKWFRKHFAGTDDLRFKIMLAAALGKCGNAEAMRFVRKMVTHDDMDLARVAVWVLARIGESSDIPAIRANRKRAKDDLSRAYFDHALAMLGDATGRRNLRKNLEHDDPAVRTYAAVFAGEANVAEAAKRLEELLGDRHVDVRVRAAQALLVLGSARPDRAEADISVDVYPATERNPRYSEGSVVELADGSLLFAVTEFVGSGSDFAKAQIIARRSTDGGRTWGPARVLQKNIGGRNVMSVTLRRLTAGSARNTPIGMFYLVKNSYSDLRVFLRISNDEGRSFGKPIAVTRRPGYHVLNNDRVTRLSSGRLLVPIASTADVRKKNHFVSWCALSDDGGKTWRAGKGIVDQPKRGAMEPEVIELKDGRVLMIARTQLGYIAAAYSENGGDTWSKPINWGVKAPEAPATLRRIPATGDLLLVWNNTFTKGAGHGGKRTPLTAAVSTDEGKSWKQIRNLETRADQTYAYTSLTFIGGRAVLSYYVRDDKTGRISSRFRSVPVSWFYENAGKRESEKSVGPKPG